MFMPEDVLSEASSEVQHSECWSQPLEAALNQQIRSNKRNARMSTSKGRNLYAPD